MLLHAQGLTWARIGEAVGHGDLVTTARTYTHVLVDEAELDYGALLGASIRRKSAKNGSRNIVSAICSHLLFKYLCPSCVAGDPNLQAPL